MAVGDEGESSKEHYETVIMREAHKYEGQIERLTYMLEEERKRSAILETELVNYLRGQSLISRDSCSFSINDEKTRIMTVSMIDARDMREKGTDRTYIAYVMNVKNSLGDQWTIYRRFRQFEVLHFYMLRRFDEHVPNFPTKRLLLGKAKKVARRQAALQEYCNFLLANPLFGSFPPLQEFFSRT